MLWHSTSQYNRTKRRPKSKWDAHWSFKGNGMEGHESHRAWPGLALQHCTTPVVSRMVSTGEQAGVMPAGCKCLRVGQFEEDAGVRRC